MGLLFTLLYIVTAYLAPQTVFGTLAEYRIEVVIAIVTLAVSLFFSRGSDLMQMPQTYAIFGITISVALSLALIGLAGMSAEGLIEFFPNAIAFFFVVLNCRKLIHIKILLLALLAVAFFIIGNGYFALQSQDLQNPYLLSQNANGGTILRIRGLSFLNDPNDLAQFIVGLIPCLFIFWGKGKTFSNLFLVILPIAALIFGTYLTHSRGGMVALMVSAIVAGRRKIGLLPSAIAGGVVFLGLSALGWSGGRGVNASEGADRMEAWSTGLELIKAHPITGVGYQRFNEFFYITAHNSVIVCAAELGLVGLFFWMLFVVPTVRDAVSGSGDARRKAELQAIKERESFSYPGARTPELGGELAFADAGLSMSPGVQRAALGSQKISARYADLEGASSQPKQMLSKRFTGHEADPDTETDLLPRAEAERISGLMMVSLAGFLAAGWFLSRAYPMTLYVNLGIAACVARLARQAGVAPPPLPFARAAWISFATGLALVMVVYVIIRIQHLFPH